MNATYEKVEQIKEKLDEIAALRKQNCEMFDACVAKADEESCKETPKHRGKGAKWFRKSTRYPFWHCDKIGELVVDGDEEEEEEEE